MISASLLTPIPDALAKILGERYGMPATEIALARFVIQTLTAMPLLLATEGASGFRVRHLGLNLLRGSLMAIGSSAFFVALRAMPLADAIAIFFVQPMIVTLLSIMFLGEAIDLRRVVAVLVGFGGALLIIRPNMLVFGWVATLPLVCALSLAIYLVLGRHLAKTDSSLGMHFYTGLGGAVSILLIMFLDSSTDITALWISSPVAASTWHLVVVMGGFASLVHLMYIQAYRLAPASLLAPFGYFEIVSAAALGLALFHEFPDSIKAFGMVVIAASGVALIWAERSRRAESLI